ncbi:MAG: transporter substrate-binding domain-containing protein [Desulfobacterales bacterium]|nr:transporter substrate-binding domain-containing protein [Desulfobacterales bacterium]
MMVIFLTDPDIVFSKNKVILTTHNIYPYGSFPSGEEKLIADESFTGTAVSVVRCVFKKMDIQLEIQVVSWNRAQVMVRAGGAHGFFAASRQESRDRYAVLSDRIGVQKWNWYLLKDSSLNPETPSFKKEALVGGYLGTNALKWMEDNGYRIMDRSHDNDTLLKILLWKRVDAIMTSDDVMDALIRENGIQEKIKVYVNKVRPLGVYFSKGFLKNQPGFLDTFNSHLAQCRK